MGAIIKPLLRWHLTSVLIFSCLFEPLLFPPVIGMEMSADSLWRAESNFAKVLFNNVIDYVLWVLFADIKTLSPRSTAPRPKTSLCTGCDCETETIKLGPVFHSHRGEGHLFLHLCEAEIAKRRTLPTAGERSSGDRFSGGALND